MSEEAEEVALPEQKIETPDYNPQDAYHVRKWELAGKPDVDKLDGDGNKWKPFIVSLLQEDGTYLRRKLPDPEPLSDVERLQKSIQDRLDSDEEKRTGIRPNPSGAVPLSRSWAATAMLYSGWGYPSEEDLTTGNNPAILAKIYADPTTRTTEESSVDQKLRALHFTLVMLEGQRFGLDYQAELGAYERTASGAFLAKLADDKERDWLKLPVHKWASVSEMFADLMS